MNASEIIKAVTRYGGKITVAGGALALSAPRPLPDTLLAEIRRNKPAIIATIQGRGAEHRHIRNKPALPKSVYAFIDFHRRTKFEKPASDKMAAWLAKDTQAINQYEDWLEQGQSTERKLAA